MSDVRDHGGGLDIAIKEYGGVRNEWIDLSTGINPNPYSIPKIPSYFWNALPDSEAQNSILNAARLFWNIPKDANIIATSGVSQLIAIMPNLLPAGNVEIISPTYNEHAAAFRSNGWKVGNNGNIRVVVNPNNPNGKHHLITEEDSNNSDLIIIDESFCDVTPEKSLIHLASQKNVIILKGLGKFWGLAGLRLGFAIAAPELIKSISKNVGPWAISGPAQFIGKAALLDINWISNTRLRLKVDSTRLDRMMIDYNIKPIGGTDLFRLFEVEDAHRIQIKLAKNYIWTRVFPYSTNWLRLGIPKNNIEFDRLAKALEE